MILADDSITYEKIKQLALVITVVSFLFLVYINQAIVGVMLLALILWSLFPKRFIPSSIIIMLILLLLQSSVSIESLIKSVLAAYGTGNILIVLSGFILAAAMDRTGLAKRIAIRVVLFFNKKPRYLLLSIAIANLFISSFSPSTTAKAFIMLPICIGFIEALNLKKGSLCAAVIILMCMTANNISSTAFLTATVPNPISANYMANAGLKLSWSDWFLMAFPLTVILLIISWLLLEFMFKPDFKCDKKTLKNIDEMHKKLGSLKREEKIVAVIFTISLILWIADKYVPFNAASLTSLVLSASLFLPKIGIFKISKITGMLPWDSLFVFAAAMYLAQIVQQTQALTPIVKELIGQKNTNLPTYALVLLVLLFGTFIHIIFTTTTVYATIIMPIAIAIANIYSVPVSLLALPIAFIAPLALILPINTIPNIIFYSEGYFSIKQMVIYGIVLSIISILLIMFIGIPYWRLIGLIR
ncbi:MAG: DASS family sodium-coupled anion symporter [Candidatus Micrarchaeales archaeon]|jgi:anion transporter